MVDGVLRERGTLDKRYYVAYVGYVAVVKISLWPGQPARASSALLTPD